VFVVNDAAVPNAQCRFDVGELLGIETAAILRALDQ